MTVRQGETSEPGPQGRALRLARMPLARLRDEVLSGAQCMYDPYLHTGPDVEEEPEADRAVREAVAREVCAACPARMACLVYALRIRPVAGVWAGFTAEELTAMLAAGARPAGAAERLAA